MLAATLAVIEAVLFAGFGSGVLASAATLAVLVMYPDLRRKNITRYFASCRNTAPTRICR